MLMSLSPLRHWHKSVRRRSCRFELATATSLDGECWGVATFSSFGVDSSPPPIYGFRTF